MTVLRLVLGDQLSCDLSSLADIDKKNDIVLMCEVRDEATYVRHHKQKLVFILASMRRFAATLREQGCNVRYVALDDPGNGGSFTSEVGRALRETKATTLVLTEPGEYRVRQMIEGWADRFGIAVQVRPDRRFLCSIGEFKNWLGDKRQPRMEYFYREMRKRYDILMQPDGEPEGGRWNYDKDNRSPNKKTLNLPPLPAVARHTAVDEAMTLVERRFGDHFGTLDHFNWPTSREEALHRLDHFITHALPHFGAYQDNMLTGEPFIYHAVLSAALNIGFLNPLEICRRAEQAWRDGAAPLNAAEGFIRQILGWREFVRGIYWAHMPRYGRMNHLDARAPLPDLYWDADTDMHCLAEAVRHTRDHAYSHHIQRLMVTGNFALLAGLDVQAVCEWYLLVYADAYEWVEMPNTLGMALFADGGIMGSKPYAASGKYINRMSNFCRSCRFDPAKTIGADACPFNALYWNFIDRNRDALRNNVRMAPMYRSWDRMADDKKDDIRKQARMVMDGLTTTGGYRSR